jgi:alpha-L-rhamnosidase
MKTHDYSFSRAIPVWEIGTQTAKNRGLAFVASVPKSQSTLCIAGSSQYVVLVNGVFAEHGPARAAHGFYRVDELDISDLLTQTINTVEIRVFGYNINTFEYLDQPSFLCAEIISDGKVTSYTAAPKCEGFKVYGIDERVMRSNRYSFQRAFVENWRVDNGYFNYGKKDEISLEPTEKKHFICRDLPYGDHTRLYPERVFGRGTVSYSEKEKYYSDRSVVNICDTYRGYREDELEYASYIEIGKMDFSARSECVENPDAIEVGKDCYVDLAMAKNYCGMIEFELEADGDGEFFITFDEILMSDGTLNCFRMDTSNILSFICKKGSYKIISAEPYVMKYVRFIAKGASFTVKNFKIIEIAFPKSAITARFKSDDAVMKKIYDAAELTFRANTVDIYMDCPSRERAGWLCDSFFTSRVEYALTGKSEVEKQFLANFIMPEKLPHVPEGMLPMCYPADHDQPQGCFIPSWAMFYGMELYEYLARTGDREFIDAAKDRMYSLCKYFEKFENEYGLLEKLESWVFVEWSHANKLVQDVSFPNNMVYSAFLSSIAELYGDREMADKAEKIKNTVREMSMTESGFFCDNAYRKDGKLELSGEHTEACQYYAFFTGIATPTSHPWLWNTLVNDFGYNRATTGKFPEIYPANAFIGNYLRLDLLDRYGYKTELYNNIKGYFEYMADRTGTLWEHANTFASCNHGFASHVIYWMKSLGIVI